MENYKSEIKNLMDRLKSSLDKGENSKWSERYLEKNQNKAKSAKI